MKKIIAAVVLLFSITFFSCNSNTADTPGAVNEPVTVSGTDPKAVLTQFFEALSKKDVATARRLTTKESGPTVDILEMGILNENGDKEALKFSKIKMEIGEPMINGDNAKVPVKEISTGETLNYILKKENGSWKVALDGDSMMNMGDINPADMEKELNDTRLRDSIINDSLKKNK